MSAAVMRLPLPRGRAGADQLPPFLRNHGEHATKVEIMDTIPTAEFVRRAMPADPAELRPIQ